MTYTSRHHRNVQGHAHIVLRVVTGDSGLDISARCTDSRCRVRHHISFPPDLGAAVVDHLLATHQIAAYTPVADWAKE